MALSPAPLTRDQRKAICDLAAQRPVGHGYLHYILSYEALAVSLEERVRLLEGALDRIRGETADPPYAWIAAIAHAALATPGERENG